MTKMNTIITRLGFLCCLILFGTNIQAQEASISQNLFIQKRVKNSKGAYERLHLKDAAVSQFNVERFLEKHIEDFDIRIFGNRTSELESQKFDFDSKDITIEDCQRFCAKKESEATAFLGVQVEKREGADGVRIVRTIAGSAAEKAGLQIGDAITHIDDLIVHSPCDLNAMISEYYPGDRIKITYETYGSEQATDLTLGARMSSMITWEVCCGNSDPNIAQNVLQTNASFYIAPNPNTGRFQLGFEMEAEEAVLIRITDNAGRTIYKETINDFNGFYQEDLDISNAGAGLYYLNIIQRNKVISKKIVLQKK